MMCNCRISGSFSCEIVSTPEGVLTIAIRRIYNYSGLILVNTLLPSLAEWTAASDRTDSFTDHFVIELRSLVITVIVDCPISPDAKVLCRLNSVDIRAEKQKLPAVFALFFFDHLHDLITGITVTCVLHSIGGDDEQRMLRHIFLTGILVDVPDVMDTQIPSLCLKKTVRARLFFSSRIR